MIRQKFRLKEYDWSVQVYYAVDCYYTDEIMEALYSIGCRGKNLSVAFNNLSSCKLDTGLTYSNYSPHGLRLKVFAICISKCFRS